jgi:hypothetical protein
MNDTAVLEYIQRGFSVEAQVDDVLKSKRQIVSKINTGAIDRHRSWIQTLGIDLEEYRANPVVLWEHGQEPVRGKLPIARNGWIRIEKDGLGRLMARTDFRDDEFSRMLYDAYVDGGLRGWSIRAIPVEFGRPTREEIRSRPELEDGCDVVYRRSTLVEYSATCLPSNPETLTTLVERGLWLPDAARAMLESSGMASGGALVKPEIKTGEVKRYIKKKGDQYIVYSESGKVLGKHPTRAKAAAQLATIEANKEREAKREIDPEEEEHEGGKEPEKKPESKEEEEGKAAEKKREEKKAEAKRYMISDGQNWSIHEPDGKLILSVHDGVIANEIMRAFDEKPLEFHDYHKRMIALADTRAVSLKEDIKAMMDLVFRGQC